MTADEAVRKREDVRKVSDELEKLDRYLAGDPELAKKLSEVIGALDIQVRLEQACRHLDDYTACLSNALQKTELKGDLV